MSVNFTSESYSQAFIESIQSDKINIDGYEVTNLISDNIIHKIKGFMVEYFIKPPINIIVYFKKPVEISHVIINPQLGKQKSKDFTISVLINDNLTNQNLIDIKNKSFQNLVNANWKFLNKTCLISSHQDITFKKNDICFYNPNYNPLTSDNSLDIKNVDKIPKNHGSHHVNLLNRNIKFIKNVMLLKLTILSVYSSSCAVIKSLDIFGKPSVPVNKQHPDESKCILEILKASFKFAANSNHDVKCKKKRELSPNKENKYKAAKLMNKEVMVSADECNLDPITLECLTNPILLPSGKVINASTLFKCLETQKLLGHLPSDPFTGLIFDRTRCPVKYNSTLSPNLHNDTEGSEKLSQVPNTIKEALPLNILGKSYRNKAGTAFLCDFCYCGQAVIYQIDPCYHLICLNCLDAKQQTSISNKLCLNGCNSSLVNKNIKRIYDIPIPRKI